MVSEIFFFSINRLLQKEHSLLEATWKYLDWEMIWSDYPLQCSQQMKQASISDKMRTYEIMNVTWDIKWPFSITNGWLKYHKVPLCITFQCASDRAVSIYICSHDGEIWLLIAWISPVRVPLRCLLSCGYREMSKCWKCAISLWGWEKQAESQPWMHNTNGLNISMDQCING